MRESERMDEIVQLLPAVAGGLARAAAAGGSLAARAAGAAGRGAVRAGREAVKTGGRVVKAGGKVVKGAGKQVARKVGQELAAGAGERHRELDARERELAKKELELGDVQEACWKGYEKKGMKTMFGKRYPNCVKKKRKLRETIENLSEEGLRAWFGNSRSKGGKPGWVQVVSGKPCARQPGQKSTPKCVSSSKRASMSDSERKSAQARKRRADPGQPQKSGAAKPT